MKTEQEILIVEVSKDGRTFTLENGVTLKQEAMKKLEGLTNSQIIYIKDFKKP